MDPLFPSPCPVLCPYKGNAKPRRSSRKANVMLCICAQRLPGGCGRCPVSFLPDPPYLRGDVSRRLCASGDAYPSHEYGGMRERLQARRSMAWECDPRKRLGSGQRAGRALWSLLWGIMDLSCLRQVSGTWGSLLSSGDTRPRKTFTLWGKMVPVRIKSPCSAKAALPRWLNVSGCVLMFCIENHVNQMIRRLPPPRKVIIIHL